MALLAVEHFFTDRSAIPSLYLELMSTVHRYLWQRNRREFREKMSELASIQSSGRRPFMLDTLALIYLYISQLLWQQAYDLAEELLNDLTSCDSVYSFLRPEVENLLTVIAAMAYGDNLPVAVPEEYFIARLGAILHTIGDKQLMELLKEGGGWLLRVRNI